MESAPKVHRQRHRQRRESQQRRQERQSSNATTPPTAAATATPTATTTATTTPTTTVASATAEHVTVEMGASVESRCGSILAAEEGCAALNDSESVAGVAGRRMTTRLSQENERQSSADSIEMVGSPSQTSQHTVLLVNGHAVNSQDSLLQHEPEETETACAVLAEATATPAPTAVEDSNTQLQTTKHLESPTQPTKVSDGSRNSSGDAMSLRETLQQLPPTVSGHRHHHHHSHRGRTHSPQSPAARVLEVDSSFHRGILGYMDRELKQSSPTPSALSVGAASNGGGTGTGTGTGTAASGSGTGASSRKLQSLSDPQASPAQNSMRSRGSFEKSPRRKRSKSESRRRRERKLIAAGEMEVRQANETLMRYLKQCSEMNDASLSGELEIDQSYDERRVHRKTKSQRDKRGHLLSKLYSAGGLSSILKELTDDIVPAEGEEIYNPFTPVVSPTDDTPAHIDKLFLQTSSGYRPVEHGYYKRSFVGGGSVQRNANSSAAGVNVGRLVDGAGNQARGSACGTRLLRSSSSYGDTRFLLDSEFNRQEITSNIQLSCVIQRIWLLISNICHGLLAGLALAHLLFVVSSHPMDWSKVIKAMSLAGETSTFLDTVSETSPTATTTTTTPLNDDNANVPTVNDTKDKRDAATLTMVGDYAAFAEIYLNTFYCLAIICLVSVFDRMDICRWNFSNASELISFRWLIITMIYIATIILTICSDSIDEKLYLFNNNANVTLTQQEMLSNSVQSVWSSLSVTRSIAAICGWIMIGLTPNEDMLYEHLVDLTKYQLTNN